ncbi:hypothetical protein [Paracoccus aminophilus]|uniref:Uncharacterized protein n=1 Tax=Paracoccus aminophilus JCM 7686 TaxID=1367847 RepID=S5XWU5_PARAH|nr:hypothetical protein [Paracoccus aminophilus]AGT07895.1 hypothetical protein JCM7686_0786 [Paracoccus aminophilus JCM 7686]
MTAMFPVRAAVRQMTIQQALEWAFATECARLDFDELGAKEFERPGHDIISVIQRRGELGCTVDGGGSSDPHPDAQIIAAAVEALPIEVGGRRMAMIVADHARARSAPDWRENERVGIVPCGWEMTDAGEWLAAIRKLPEASYYYPRGRKTLTYRPEICPIGYTGSAAVLAARRRDYLGWYGALLHLNVDFIGWRTNRVEIIDGLPDMTPWKSS